METAAAFLTDLVRKNVFNHPPVGVQEIQQAALTLMQGRHDMGTKAMALFCETFLQAYKNHNYNQEANGEKWLLERVGMMHPKIVLDVGANEGNWLLTCLPLMPTATIHAFEIVESTFIRLSERVGDFSGDSVKLSS